jgi:hypothetical protein
MILALPSLVGKDKESQGEFCHSAVLLFASRDISSILGRWLYQDWENFDNSAEFPCLTLTMIHMQLQMPGIQECEAQLFLVHWEYRVSSGAIYGGEEHGMHC